MPDEAFVDAETRAAIEDLNVEYAWLIDQGHAERLPELFAANAKLIVPKGTYSGKEAITAYARERAKLVHRKARHVCSNTRLRRIAPDRVKGTVVHTLYRHDGEGLGDPTPVAVGDWEDVYLREADGRWRYLERRVVLVYESDRHR